MMMTLAVKDIDSSSSYLYQQGSSSFVISFAVHVYDYFIYSLFFESENETNKNADKNRLRGYRFCSVDVCQQSKTASA